MRSVYPEDGKIVAIYEDGGYTQHDPGEKVQMALDAKGSSGGSSSSDGSTSTGGLKDWKQWDSENQVSAAQNPDDEAYQRADKVNTLASSENPDHAALGDVHTKIAADYKEVADGAKADGDTETAKTYGDAAAAHQAAADAHAAAAASPSPEARSAAAAASGKALSATEQTDWTNSPEDFE